MLLLRFGSAESDACVVWPLVCLFNSGPNFRLILLRWTCDCRDVPASRLSGCPNAASNSILLLQPSFPSNRRLWHSHVSLTHRDAAHFDVTSDLLLSPKICCCNARKTAPPPPSPPDTSLMSCLRHTRAFRVMTLHNMICSLDIVSHACKFCIRVSHVYLIPPFLPDICVFSDRNSAARIVRVCRTGIRSEQTAPPREHGFTDGCRMQILTRIVCRLTRCSTQLQFGKTARVSSAL